MRRKFLVLVLMAMLSCHCSMVFAQAYLVSTLKPTEANRQRISSAKADPNMDWGTDYGLRPAYIYNSNAGFVLDGDAHGFIGGDNHGFATYKLNKQYSKLSFWLGPEYLHPGINPLDKTVLTIWADGRRILDKVIFNSDPPQFVVLNIKDVDELKFKLSIGEIDLAFAKAQLWKEGVEVVQPKLAPALPAGKVKLVDQLQSYFSTTYISRLSKDNGLSMARHEFNSGLSFTSSEQLAGERVDYSFFWLNKKYDKISFILGARDNQSSNSTAWLVIYGDNKKILYEGIVTQKDLPRQEVVDVSGQDKICFSCELRSNDFLGSITFGAVDIYAYPKGDTSVPQEGLANLNKDKIAKLPSPCPLMSNILPYSVRGVAKAKQTMFTGESSYITFSMGGIKYMEGIILTPGTTLLDDKIDAYATFDLAGEFDYVSFYAGALTNRRVLDDGRLRVYADDKLILDTMIYCTMPNEYFELPLNKCRSLRFAKPSDGKDKQIFIGLGDITLYRGKPVANDLFYHEYPDFPEEADLIDLCTRPYFHYVGRYLSSLTNFDFNDCFVPGGSQRNFFQMKDGSKIYKGVMLEANVPLPFEDITLSEAVFMFVVGAGSSISSSSVGAATGTTAGAGLAGDLAVKRLMNNKTNGQASVVAFNPFGQYQSCTFTVANKSEYWDDMDKVVNLGKPTEQKYKLNVFADQRLVKEIWVHNTMEPQTFTVPIFNCHQLMFWLEPGEYRSGQFVLYDMTVSKKPCNNPIPDKMSAAPTAKDGFKQTSSNAEKMEQMMQNAQDAGTKKAAPQNEEKEEYPLPEYGNVGTPEDDDEPLQKPVLPRPVLAE